MAALKQVRELREFRKGSTTIRNRMEGIIALDCGTEATSVTIVDAKRRYQSRIEKEREKNGTASTISLGSYAQFLIDIGGQKEYKEAEKHFRTVVERGPRTRPNKFIEQRVKELNIEATHMPLIDTAWCIYTGIFATFLCTTRQSFREAAKLFDLVLQENPNDSLALGNYASLLHCHLKDYPQARKLYEKAVVTYPNHATVLGNYANFIKLVDADYDKSEQYYKYSIDANPEHPDCLGNYAVLLHSALKRYDDAEKMYERALLADGFNANNLGNAALFAVEVRQNYNKGRQLYERAISADPTHAEQLYQRAIKSDPEHAFALHTYAVLLEDVRKDFDKAEKYFRLALSVKEDDPLVLGDFANFLNISKGETTEAIRYYEKSLSIDCNQVDVLYNYGNLLKRIANFDKAENLYERAINLDPDHSEALGNLGNIKADVRNDNDLAESLYRRALAIDPHNAENLGNFADFLYDSRNNIREAESFYMQAVESDPSNSYNVHNYAQFLVNTKGRSGGIGDESSETPNMSEIVQAFTDAETLLHSVLQPNSQATTDKLSSSSLDTGIVFDCDCVSLLAFVVWRWPISHNEVENNVTKSTRENSKKTLSLPPRAKTLNKNERLFYAETLFNSVLELDNNHVFSLVQFSNLLKMRAHELSSSKNLLDKKEKLYYSKKAEEMLQKAQILGAI